MNNNNDDVIEQFGRLLERLQQAGGEKTSGSHYTFIYVAPGAQHVENQINIRKPLPKPEALPEPKTLPGPPCVGRENGTSNLPEVLATDEAMALWKKAQDAGYVDEYYQPLLSRTRSALLADTMAERLGIKEKWKVFESLWHRKYMRSDYSQALSRKQTYEFLDELKMLFG